MVFPDFPSCSVLPAHHRAALTKAKSHGVTPFCITINRESEQQLKDLDGDVGYPIIDDVLSLPEKLPNIYRRLTS